VEVAAELLAGIVEATRELLPAIVRVDHHLDAVERVALRIVVSDVTSVGDAEVVVPLGVVVVVDDEGRRGSYELTVHLDADLALGEVRDLALERVAAKGPQLGEAAARERAPPLVIVGSEQALHDARLEVGQVDRHGRSVARGGSAAARGRSSRARGATRTVAGSPRRSQPGQGAGMIPGPPSRSDSKKPKTCAGATSLRKTAKWPSFGNCRSPSVAIPPAALAVTGGAKTSKPSSRSESTGWCTGSTSGAPIAPASASMEAGGV